MFTITGTTEIFESAEQVMKAWYDRKQQGETGEIQQITEQQASQLRSIEAIFCPDAAREQRRAEQLRMLAQHGVILPGLRFGANLRVQGDKICRKRFEALPHTAEALDSLKKQIIAEQREDRIIEASELQMLDDGTLRTSSGETLLLERQALSQLIARGGAWPHASKYFAAISPAERAWNWNARRGEAKRVTLRTRDSELGRSVFAVVSKSYRSFDAQSVCDLLQEQLAGYEDTRAIISYCPETTNVQADVLLHSREAVGTDVFQVGVRLRSNDSASGSINGSALAYRHQCLNMQMIGEGSSHLFRQQHRGNVRVGLLDGLEEAQEIFSSFAEDWGMLRSVDACEHFGVPDVPSALEAMAGMQLLRDAAPVQGAELVSRLREAWELEQGQSLADLVNAVTRTHALTEMRALHVERMERLAGQLVPVLAQAAA